MASDNAALSPALYNRAAETACLGACLLDAKAARLVLERTRESDYTYDRNRAVYRAVQRLLSRAEPVDWQTVQRECVVGKVDVPATLTMDLQEAVPSAANVEAYIAQVREASARRSVRLACQVALAATEDPSSSLPETTRHLAEDVEIALDGNGSGPADIVPVRIDAALKLWMQQWDTQPCALTPLGFSRIDSALGGGVEDGEFVVLGGRAGTGKTALVLEIARHVASAGKGVLIVSREMRVRKLLNRLLAQTGHLPAISLRSGLLSPAYYAKLSHAYGVLSPLPLWVDDRAQSMAQICRMVDRWPFTPRLQLVILDYLQLIKAPKDIRERRHQVEAVSAECKQLAMRAGCHVLAISSMARAEKKEHDRRPVLSDLRESGEIEHDADIILLLHRQFNARDAELIVAKARDAEVGIIPLSFAADQVAFTDATGE